MTFAEADAQYEIVKQRYLAGALADEQYDDQLRQLMVQDDLGRWWAKSRENGVWHYYDGVTGSWLPGAPPVDAPAAPVHLPASQPPAHTPASLGSPSLPASPSAAARSAPESNRAALPKWAAVAPASPQSSAAGSAGKAAPPDRSRMPPSAAPSSYRVGDFAPLPELRGSLKIALLVLALLVPFVGFVLYFVYRHKPAGADRSAARTFLILGIVSLVLYSLVGVAIVQLESMNLRAR